MIGPLPWRNKTIFIVMAIVFNGALVFLIYKINENYFLRHYSSDQYYQLQPVDDFR